MENSINYFHIVEQTHEEKMAMYMKLSKKELAQMIIQCNNLLEGNFKRQKQPYQPCVASDYPFPNGTFIMTADIN